MKKVFTQWLAVLLFASASTASHAAVIFDFEGTCSVGCVGTATGTLTLADTFSDTPSSADFMSFTYASSSGSYSIPGGGDFLEIFDPSTGVFPADFGLADVFLDWTGPQSYFVTAVDSFNNFLSGNTDANWASRLAAGLTIDAGTSFSWTLRETASVPEPGSFGLLGLALLGIAISRRKLA